MQPRSLAILARLASVLALAPIASTCGDDDVGTTPTSPLVGTWNAISITAHSEDDFIALGMTLTAVLTSSGTYTLTITYDWIGACSTGSDCTQTGNWTSTGTTVTLNPGTADAATFVWSIHGTTMTWGGDLDDIPATVRFARQ